MLPSVSTLLILLSSIQIPLPRLKQEINYIMNRPLDSPVSGLQDKQATKTIALKVLTTHRKSLCGVEALRRSQRAIRPGFARVQLNFFYLLRCTGPRARLVHLPRLHHLSTHHNTPRTHPLPPTSNRSMKIVPDDAAGRRVFSKILSFPRPCILALLHTNLASPSMALKISQSSETTHHIRTVLPSDQPEQSWPERQNWRVCDGLQVSRLDCWPMGIPTVPPAGQRAHRQNLRVLTCRQADPAMCHRCLLYTRDLLFLVDQEEALQGFSNLDEESDSECTCICYKFIDCRHGFTEQLNTSSTRTKQNNVMTSLGLPAGQTACEWEVLVTDQSATVLPVRPIGRQNGTCMVGLKSTITVECGSCNVSDKRTEDLPWSGWDANLRPLDYKSATLPLRYGDMTIITTTCKNRQTYVRKWTSWNDLSIHTRTPPSLPPGTPPPRACSRNCLSGTSSKRRPPPAAPPPGRSRPGTGSLYLKAAHRPRQCDGLVASGCSCTSPGSVSFMFILLISGHHATLQARHCNGIQPSPGIITTASPSHAQYRSDIQPSQARRCRLVACPYLHLASIGWPEVVS
ncbi:hypothetical protein PR048_005190 [Dryococelus australis]|uniref:Uncharacterized protein n=1 Tax=Dryococelus australis TaxID=614101 RepID=A0ABQ9I7H3_9NEOP|nr:hypothetical protein PR048_005190 [Dryococelus australis]